MVAIYIPALKDWASKFQIPLSKLLIPLSYAAIAGGTCTLIGTSTNLVVNGLITEETHEPGLNLLELAWIGLPVTFLVIAYVLLTQSRLLPERQRPRALLANAREYLVEMMLDLESPLVGQSITTAGLRNLPGLYLVEIERHGELLPAISIS